MRRLRYFALFFALIPAAFSATIRVPADYPTIQGAIDAAVSGDSVLVAPGTFNENLRIIDKALVVDSESGPMATVIDGMGLSYVVFTSSNQEVVIRGFTIRNGQSFTGIACAGSNRIVENRITGNGFGIECTGRAVIQGNTIERNVAAGIRGIGRHSDLLIIENRIIANGNGGLYLWYARPRILNNLIAKNDCLGLGGGIHCHDVSLCRISGNSIIKNSGCGVYCVGSNTMEPLIVTDNIIAGNDSTQISGGLYVATAVAALTGNTIVYNQSGHDVGGLRISNPSMAHPLPAISNTVVWSNTGTVPEQVTCSSSHLPGVLDIHHSLIEGGISGVSVCWNCTLNWGPGMIDLDPRFVDPRLGDYHLSWDSPCRDAGDNGSAVWGPNDFEGDPRIAGASVDIGADEFYYHLYHMGDVVAGGTTTLRVVGLPTAPVQLALGSPFSIGGMPTPFGDLFIGRPPYPFSMSGTVPPRGVLDFSLPVPATASPGDLFPLQALVGPIGSSRSRLTNLHVLEVE